MQLEIMLSKISQIQRDRYHIWRVCVCVCIKPYIYSQMKRMKTRGREACEEERGGGLKGDDGANKVEAQ